MSLFDALAIEGIKVRVHALERAVAACIGMIVGEVTGDEIGPLVRGEPIRLTFDVTPRADGGGHLNVWFEPISPRASFHDHLYNGKKSKKEKIMTTKKAKKTTTKTTRKPAAKLATAKKGSRSAAVKKAWATRKANAKKG